MSRRFSTNFLSAGGSALLAGNLLSPTGKPHFHSERGRGTRKENELNQIPHPSESYHASGGSASAQLAQLGCNSSISVGKWGWENGTGGSRFRLLRLASQSKQFKSYVGVGVSQRDGTHAPLPWPRCPAAARIRALKSWDLRSGTAFRDSRDTARSSKGPCKRGLFKIYADPPAFKYLICQLI